MKTVFTLAAAGLVSLGVLTAGGCGSNNSQPSDNSNSTAGGNGAFGESPARPGSYQGDQYNRPTTQPSSFDTDGRSK